MRRERGGYDLTELAEAVGVMRRGRHATDWRAQPRRTHRETLALGVAVLGLLLVGLALGISVAALVLG